MKDALSKNCNKMLGLVNMRRFLYIFFLSFLTSQVNAQILNMSDTQEYLSVPIDFLKSIQDCNVYEQTVMSAPEGVETKMVYKVNGKKNGKCDVQIDGYTNVTVHINQSCLFTMEQAAEYANSIYRYQNKHYYFHKDLNRILYDPDYVAATKLMTDENICKFHRDGIDVTSEFRKKLADCTPYTETQHLESVDIVREIKAAVNGVCKIDVTFTQRLPNMELRAEKITSRMWEHIKKFKEAHYPYSCSFNDDKRKEYLAVLEALVVPEEDGFDFSAVQRFSQISEMEFIYKNCTYVVK